MASSLEITPALGHGIVTAQNMPGGYDAIDDRRQWSVGRQEGAVDVLAYKVTQKSEGANLSVDVATDGGHFLVQGDDVDHQGLYLIPATALKANLDLETAPDITNPRVDQVVLEALDEAHNGGTVTRGRVYVLTGTPTSGADVVDSAAYEASKAALPPSTALLAEFVVDANATSITDADIRDRRPWALGAYCRIVRNSNAGGGSDYTLSGSSAPLDATNLQPRVECSGAPLRVRLKALGNLNPSGAGGQVVRRCLLDGVTAPEAPDAYEVAQAASIAYNYAILDEWTLLPEAGSHLVGFTAFGGGSWTSAKLYAQADPLGLVFEVQEMVGRSSASND